MYEQICKKRICWHRCCILAYAAFTRSKVHSMYVVQCAKVRYGILCVASILCVRGTVCRSALVHVYDVVSTLCVRCTVSKSASVHFYVIVSIFCVCCTASKSDRGTFGAYCRKEIDIWAVASIVWIPMDDDLQPLLRFTHHQVNQCTRWTFAREGTTEIIALTHHGVWLLRAWVSLTVKCIEVNLGKRQSKSDHQLDLSSKWIYSTNVYRLSCESDSQF